MNECAAGKQNKYFANLNRNRRSILEHAQQVNESLQ